MQFLALNIINNGETILKEVLENQKFHNLSRVYVRKYFLQKIVYLGNLEKSYTYHIESELLDFFRFFAQEMILSKFNFFLIF